jgi:predicted ABC-type ATPase
MQKEVIIVADSNGAGKTTFAREFLVENPNYEFLNADEIAKDISPNNLENAKVEAGKQFFGKLTALTEVDRSVVIESTLSGRYLIRWIKNLRGFAYEVRIIFIFVESPEIAIERIADRVKKGGHFVPDNDVRRRFTRGIANFWSVYRNLVTRWQLIYNSEGRFEEVAFGEEDNFKVTDEELFKNFLTSINES